MAQKSKAEQKHINKKDAPFELTPHLLDSMVYYLISGVFFYAKRSTKQTIYAGIQKTGD